MNLSICLLALAVLTPMANAWWYKPPKPWAWREPFTFPTTTTTRAPVWVCDLGRICAEPTLVCDRGRCVWSTKCGTVTESKYQYKTPTRDGCVGAGLPSMNPYGFDSCCDDHDTCYGTTGSTKEGCDNQMDVCMKEICNDRGWDDFLCHGVRHKFNDALDVAGVNHYGNAQRKHVRCR